MPSFHLYFMSRGSPVDARSIEAFDEDEAADIAQAMNDGDAVELWNDYRRLRILDNGRAQRLRPEAEARG